MDWALQTAKDYLNSLDCDDLDCVEGPGNPYDTLAAALRKAKAAGMREAANQIWRRSRDEALISREVVWDAFSQANSRADAIEKGA